MSDFRPATKIAAADARAVRLLPLPAVRDARGHLVWGEIETHLPFVARRFFFIRDVPAGGVRGDHAHRGLAEVMICVNGACCVTADDGRAHQEFVLDAPDLGLYLPPLTWSTQHRFTRDAVLLVLASEVYRPDDYVRDRAEFRILAEACR